jgi:hypothetical protein
MAFSTLILGTKVPQSLFFPGATAPIWALAYLYETLQTVYYIYIYTHTQGGFLLDEFTALRFTAANAPPAARHM